MISSRPPLMETSVNNATSSPAPSSTAARRSGRVAKPVQKFTPDAPAKRKRAAEHDDEDDDVENESPDGGDEVSDVDDDDSAVEEPRRKPKKRAPSQPAKTRKPAAKKPKINGEASAPAGTNGMNHIARLPSRPKKTAPVAIARPNANGLYTKIFSSGEDADTVAADWFNKYQADEAEAVAELVNCILLCAGCDRPVTVDDIQDPENCQNRLADLQNVYAEEGITDYPLVSRSRSSRSFRDLLVGFIKSLVTLMHETEVLYKDPALWENIARWVASMSSSTQRPFRHTATTVALAMETSLADVAKKLDERITKTTQQLDAEKSRRGGNKEKLAAIKENLAEAERNREMCGDHIKDNFDTIFIHRYRDIDPKIRTECIEALGLWIWNLPTVFMSAEYLRYLGWMLTDEVGAIRHEIIKQLMRILKRDAEKIGHFIDRFRPRLVEMATRDLDTTVRVSAISLMEILKNTGMLEPDEIDSIARLVFDSDIRVRRAIVDFFAGCVNDSIETRVESIGGADVVDELFGDEDTEEFNSPRRDWITIKCLAELLAAYDAQLEEEQETAPPRSLDVAVDIIQAVAPDTRISLAAQVLYDKIEHVKNWELLAGYLLYDHTASSKSRSKSKKNSTETVLRDAVAPVGKEEHILLEILASSAKLSLSQSGGEVAPDKSRRKHRPDAGESAEDSAIHLAAAIPRLLNKFGADAGDAVIVLRLDSFLDLDIFQQLRQDSTTYTRLLDEVCRQFQRHIHRGVLTEATAALLHARKCDELQEIANDKITELWETLINALRHFDKAHELGTRNNLDIDTIAQLGNVLFKMAKLASIANPIEVLDAEGTIDGSEAPTIELLVRLVHRGMIDQVDEELDDLEDEAVSFAIKSVHFYFMWRVRLLLDAVLSGNDLSSDEIDSLNKLRKTYETNLVYTFSSRGTNDDLRLFSTGALCDLHLLFSNFRDSIKEHLPDGLERKYALLQVLLEPIPNGLVNELLEIYDAAERAFAKCLKKTLAEPAEDEDPIDLEESDSDSDDDNNPEEENASPIVQKAKELKTEKALIELAAKLVMCMNGKMLDQTTTTTGGGTQAGRVKKRMLRNQHKLGGNLREVLAYMDDSKRMPRALAEKKPKQKGKGSKQQKTQQKGQTNGSGNNKGKKKGGQLSEEVITVAGDDTSDEELSEHEDAEIEEIRATIEDFDHEHEHEHEHPEPDPEEEEEENENEDGGDDRDEREDEHMDEAESILGD